AAVYFESVDGIQRLLQAKPNRELRKLLERLKIVEKIKEGAHAARLVFVTNALLDRAGQDYLRAVKRRQPPLDVWDRERLAALGERTKRPELRHDHVILNACAPPVAIDLEDSVKLAVALVPAKELVALPGIDDLT